MERLTLIIKSHVRIMFQNHNSFKLQTLFLKCSSEVIFFSFERKSPYNRSTKSDGDVTSFGGIIYGVPFSERIYLRLKEIADVCLSISTTYIKRNSVIQITLCIFYLHFYFN